MSQVDFTNLKTLIKKVSDKELQAEIAKAVARIEIEVNGVVPKKVIGVVKGLSGKKR